MILFIAELEKPTERRNAVLLGGDDNELQRNEFDFNPVSFVLSLVAVIILLAIIAYCSNPH